MSLAEKFGSKFVEYTLQITAFVTQQANEIVGFTLKTRAVINNAVETKLAS